MKFLVLKDAVDDGAGMYKTIGASCEHNKNIAPNFNTGYWLMFSGNYIFFAKRKVAIDPECNL